MSHEPGARAGQAFFEEWSDQMNIEGWRGTQLRADEHRGASYREPVSHERRPASGHDPPLNSPPRIDGPTVDQEPTDLAAAPQAEGGPTSRRRPKGQPESVSHERQPESGHDPPGSSDQLTTELDAAWPNGSWPLADPIFGDDFDDPDTRDWPDHSNYDPATPAPPAPYQRGTPASYPVPELGVERVCGVDASSVKMPIESEWSGPPRDDFNGPGSVATASAKDERYETFFSRRAWEFHQLCPGSTTSQPAAGLTGLELAGWVATKLGMSLGDFLYAVDNDLTHLDRFVALCVEEDDGSRLDLSNPPGTKAMWDPLPELPAIPERPAPAAEVDTPPDSELPPEFSGKFEFYSMFKDPARARRLVERWQLQTIEDARHCFRALAEKREPRVKSREPLIFLPEDFHDCLVGRHINCQLHDACFVTHMSDQEANHLRPDGEQVDQIAHERVAADLGHEKYNDQEFLHGLRYGHDSRSKQPWCLIFCSMNKSAAKNLPVVAKAVDDGVLAGWQDASTHVTAVPAVFEPFGLAYKHHSVDKDTGKPKPRLTTDKSGPRNQTDAEGTPLADNEGIDLEADHPETKLIRASDIRRAIETLGSIVRAITPRVRAAAASEEEADRAEAALQVDLATDDMKAYFSQFK